MRRHTPEPLPPRSATRPVVRIVHPSGSVGDHLDVLQAGIACLEGAGCSVRWDERRAEDCWRGYYAGTDDARAEEFLTALSEPEVDIVWFARGGSGVSRLVDRVIHDAARLAPRTVVGFSDATALLNALSFALGWTTWHGPVVTSLARPDIECDLDGVLSTLLGERRHVSFPPSEGEPVSGTLRGGNLTVLCTLAGSPVGLGGEDALWLLEDVAEPAYRLDRAFHQLRWCGALRGCRGVWAGDLGIEPEAQTELLEGWRADAAPIPVLAGAPAGHRGRLEALPIGARVELDPCAGELRWEAA